MNPRQRRGLLLIVVAIAGAIAVFVSVANYVTDVETQVGPLTTVMRLTEDAVPYQPVTAEMVEEVEVPARWTPDNALTTGIELDGRVPTTVLPAGTVLQDGVLIDPPQLEDEQRELAILVDAETGVAGKIGRGSIVDILATFSGSEQEPPHASVVVENAEILEVGSPTTSAETDEAGGFSQGQVVPVTFALSVDESLRLAYVESFATSVRLALRAPDDDEPVRPRERLYQPDGPVVLPSDDQRGDGAQ